MNTREELLARIAKPKELPLTHPATRAVLSGRWVAETYGIDEKPPRIVRVYSPDGGVLTVASEADAAHVVADLNELIELREELSSLPTLLI